MMDLGRSTIYTHAQGLVVRLEYPHTYERLRGPEKGPAFLIPSYESYLFFFVPFHHGVDQFLLPMRYAGVSVGGCSPSRCCTSRKCGCS